MIKPWPVHTLVFDLDDTLYPERAFVLSGFAAVDAWLQRELKVTGFRETAEQLFSAGLRGQIFDEALPRLRLVPSVELIGQLVAVYRAHEPQLALFPEAAEILAWAEKKLRLAIVTDGFAEVQRRKLAALGLEPRVALSVVTDELGREFWKPHLKGYQLIASALVGPRTGFVYIGDNARKDFIAPRKLGWRTVRILRDGGEHADYHPRPDEQAEIDIRDLRELRDLLQPVPPP
ncbi:MAG: HAD family hydrolase [Candidatus Didemnitutus sp.]|nr:HAD family hydrolase [Candidatus Didemnitutus sp.]